MRNVSIATALDTAAIYAIEALGSAAAAAGEAGTAANESADAGMAAIAGVDFIACIADYRSTSASGAISVVSAGHPAVSTGITPLAISAAVVAAHGAVAAVAFLITGGAIVSLAVTFVTDAVSTAGIAVVYIIADEPHADAVARGTAALAIAAAAFPERRSVSIGVVTGLAGAVITEMASGIAVAITAFMGIVCIAGSAFAGP